MSIRLVLINFLTLIFLFNVGCTSTPESKQDKIAKQVFEALKTKDWKKYSYVVTNRYALLSRIQNPNKFVAQGSYAATMMAPEEATRMRAAFDLVLENHAEDKENWVDFGSEEFKGIKYIDEVTEDPLTEFGDLSLLPQAYAFITDKNGKPRNPLIVMVQVKDFMHVLGLLAVDLGPIEDTGSDEEILEEDSEDLSG